MNDRFVHARSSEDVVRLNREEFLQGHRRAHPAAAGRGYSILAAIGGAIAWIFKPLGWGTWQAAMASITGLVAKG